MLLARCTYYRASAAYNTLQPAPEDWSTAFYPDLATATASNCSRLLAAVQTGAAWQQLALRVLGTPFAATCGQALQLQSATPSMGPCHPVLLPTRPYANRCVLIPVNSTKKSTQKKQHTCPYPPY